MWWLMDKIGTPEDAHNVRSPQDYVAMARKVLSGNGVRPGRVHAVAAPVEAYVSDGRWVVQCACGNGPSAHPEWRLAVCFLCGAILEAVFPPNWRTGEAILLAREAPTRRHWFPHERVARRHGIERAESVLALARENRRHDRPVRRAAGAHAAAAEPSPTMEALVEAAVDAKLRALGLIGPEAR